MPALILLMGLLSSLYAAPGAAPAAVAVAKPSARPLVKMTPVPKGQRIQSKLKNPMNELVIHPKNSGQVPVTSFELTQTGPGKLALTFISRDPNFELNTRGGFVAQITTEEPLEVEPSVVTRSKWPAGAKSVVLSFKGASAGLPNLVEGEVAYLYCHKTTKACTKAVAPLSLTVRP